MIVLRTSLFTLSTGVSHASHLGDCCPSAYSSGVSYVKKTSLRMIRSTTIGRWTAIAQVTIACEAPVLCLTSLGLSACCVLYAAIVKGVGG